MYSFKKQFSGVDFVFTIISAAVLIFCTGAYALEAHGDYGVHIGGWLIAASFLTVLVRLARAGWGATLFFTFFLIQPVVQVYFIICFFDVPPLWHDYFPRHLIERTLLTVYMQSAFFIFVLHILLSRAQVYVEMPPKPIASIKSTIFAFAVCGGLSLVVLAVALQVTRNEYVESVGTGDRAVMIIGMLMVGLGAGIGASHSGKLMRLLAIMSLIMGLLIAAAGYRYVLVSVAVAFGCVYLSRNRLTFGRIAMGGALAIGGYAFMAVLSYVRSARLTPGEILSGALNQVTAAELLKDAGKAEQILIFTVHYADQISGYLGLTYIYSAIRILPNFIGEQMFGVPRPQDIIVLGGPSAFIDAGLNLGVLFFAESTMNFGVFGSLAVTALVLFGLSKLENSRASSDWMQLIYPVIGAMMPALALYGSANVMKQTLVLLVFAVVFFKLSSAPRAADPYQAYWENRALRQRG